MACFEKTTKRLGFGMMRLPMTEGQVDIEKTTQMVDLFLQRGFTYFDTAYGYLDGASEEAIKTVLVDRYPRERFQLATKMPAWAGAKTAEEAKEMFYTSLARTGAGYFDYYLMHNLGDERTAIFEQFGIWDFLQQLKEKGLIKHIGFSFHDKAEALDSILKDHPETEFVQLQINYADWENPAIQSRKCYEVAKKHGKPIIIMEPVRGGALADLSEEAACVFRDADPAASAASWALRYAASLDGVAMVLSGMSTLAQVEDNTTIMDNFQPLRPEEYTVIENVREILAKQKTVPCTCCNYCMKGCPQHVLIPKIFTSLNVYLTYQNAAYAKGGYMFHTRNGGKASECIGCGQCEAVCPQHISIIKALKKAAEVFDS